MRLMATIGAIVFVALGLILFVAVPGIGWIGGIALIAVAIALVVGGTLAATGDEIAEESNEAHDRQRAR